MKHLKSIFFAGLIAAATSFVGCGTDVHVPEQPAPVVNLPPPIVNVTVAAPETMSTETSTDACLYGASWLRHDHIGVLTPSRVERGNRLTLAGGDIISTCRQDLFLKQVSLQLLSTTTVSMFRNEELRLNGQAVTNLQPTTIGNETTWSFGHRVEIPEMGTLGVQVASGIREDAPFGSYTVIFSKVIVEDAAGNEIEFPSLGSGFTFEIVEDASDRCEGPDCCARFAGVIWDDVTRRCVRDPSYMDPSSRSCGGPVSYERASSGNNGTFNPGEWADWNFNLTADATEDLIVNRIDTVLNGPSYSPTFEECQLVNGGSTQVLQTVIVGQSRITFTANVTVPAGASRAMKIRCRVSATRATAGLYTLAILDVRARGYLSACNVGSVGYFYDWVQVTAPPPECQRVQNGQTTKVWIDFLGEQRQTVHSGDMNVDASAFEVHACVDNVEWRNIGFHYRRISGNLDVRRPDGSALFVNHGIAVGSSQVQRIGSWIMAPNTLTATEGSMHSLNGDTPIVSNLNAGDYVYSRLRFDVQSFSEMAEGTYAVTFLSHGFFINGRSLSNDEVAWVNNPWDYVTVEP